MERLEERSGNVLPRLSSGVWAAIALLTLGSIPGEVRRLSLPDHPVFQQVRADGWRGLILHCVVSSLFLAVCVRRWHAEAAVKGGACDDAQANRRACWIQFGIIDLLAWTTAVAIALSLGKLFGSWALALMIGTCAVQANILRRPPIRRGIASAWLAVWTIVVLMVVAGIA